MSAPYYSDESVTLHLGKCEDVLPTLPECSVDAVVCDPPYDLTSGKKGGTGAASLNEAHPAGRSRITTGGGFMGKEWDATGVAFDPATWRAVLRVLKPGGHLLAFGGTRTWHRLVCAIEDAGFEIRDPIADLTGIDGPGLLWIQGQGFPKNHDVSKAIDKAGGESIAWFGPWLRAERERRGMTAHELCERGGFYKNVNHGGLVVNWETGLGMPTAAQFNKVCEILDLPFKRLSEVEREVLGSRKVHRGLAFTSEGLSELPVTAPATDAARKWDGWGTALKPAWEPIAVARKPLAGTVAANVLEWGTGALNLAACKVAHAGEADEAQYRRNASGDRGHDANRTRDMDFGMTAGHASDDGRWPPNLVLGEEAAAELDRQSGNRKAGSPVRGTEPSHRMGTNGIYGDAGSSRPEFAGFGDEGGASRFFPVFKYQAKATSAERPKLPDGTAWPTVKPLGLMQWLVRLVTPPGGTVLDPFCGSGTTAEACIVEGFRCITIDRDEVAAQLALERWRKPIQPAMFGFDEAG